MDVTGPEPIVVMVWPWFQSHLIPTEKAEYRPRPVKFGAGYFPLPVWPSLPPACAKVPTPGALCDHSLHPARLPTQLSSFFLPSLSPGVQWPPSLPPALGSHHTHLSPGVFLTPSLGLLCPAQCLQPRPDTLVVNPWLWALSSLCQSCPQLPGAWSSPPSPG